MHLHYIYNLLQGCQYIASQDRYTRLGSLDSYEWKIINATYFYITFMAGDPEVDINKIRYNVWHVVVLSMWGISYRSNLHKLLEEHWCWSSVHEAHYCKQKNQNHTFFRNMRVNFKVGGTCNKKPTIEFSGEEVTSSLLTYVRDIHFVCCRPSMLLFDNGIYGKHKARWNRLHAV